MEMYLNIHADEPAGGILFWQAALFSGVAAVLILITVWWLYFSPHKKREAPATTPSSRLAGWLAVLLGIAGLAWVVGMLWDASMHVQTGEIPSGADFLWPPHLVLYSGFLLAFLVACVTIGMVAVRGWRAGQRDPRLWFREHPFLGAVALASLYELMAIPGDALWHELFGEDLTAWSPPHVLLVLMMATVVVCTISVLIQTRQPGRRVDWQSVAVILLAGLMLNLLYIVGVLEWELPARSHPVVERPIWAYPLVGGIVAFFTLMLVRQLVDFRWAATATALAFYLIRMAITAGLDFTENIAPSAPLFFGLGALLLDVLPLGDYRWKWGRWLASAAGFTLGYALLAFPQLAQRLDLPVFTILDFTLALLTGLVASLALTPLIDLIGNTLGNPPTEAWPG